MIGPNTIEKIQYPNGYCISVINGMGTYSDHNTYEVAVITPNGTVREPEGYVTPKRLDEIKEKVKGFLAPLKTESTEETLIEKQALWDKKLKNDPPLTRIVCNNTLNSIERKNSGKTDV